MSARVFWRAGPTREIQRYGETLTWTISTDDPITFSTTLADEYAYAWAGMTMRANDPVDPSYARALLDEAAATSMRTRFTCVTNRAIKESSVVVPIREVLEAVSHDGYYRSGSG